MISKHEESETNETAKATNQDWAFSNSLPAMDASFRYWPPKIICSTSQARSRSLTFWKQPAGFSPGPYDITLVEGSITTPHDAERIQQIRRDSKFLITIGACATSGGIQALRNWADCDEFVSSVYATPDYISTLATSTAIADHVKVDFELRGCPINQYQLIEVIQSVLAGRRPRTPVHSVCLDCKRRGTVCVMVAQGISCLGPVTQAGCGAICPAYNRGCYGCYGPAAQPNLVSLTSQFAADGMPREQIVQSLRGVSTVTRRNFAKKATASRMSQEPYRNDRTNHQSHRDDSRRRRRGSVHQIARR